MRSQTFFQKGITAFDETKLFHQRSRGGAVSGFVDPVGGAARGNACRVPGPHSRVSVHSADWAAVVVAYR